LSIKTTDSRPNCIELRHKRLRKFQILQYATVSPASLLFIGVRGQSSVPIATALTNFAFQELFIVGVKHGEDKVFYNLSGQLGCDLIQRDWSFTTSWLHFIASCRDWSTLRH